MKKFLGIIVVIILIAGGVAIYGSKSYFHKEVHNAIAMSVKNMNENSPTPVKLKKEEIDSDHVVSHISTATLNVKITSVSGFNPLNNHVNIEGKEVDGKDLFKVKVVAEEFSSEGLLLKATMEDIVKDSKGVRFSITKPYLKFLIPKEVLENIRNGVSNSKVASVDMTMGVGSIVVDDQKSMKASIKNGMFEMKDEKTEGSFSKLIFRLSADSVELPKEFEKEIGYHKTNDLTSTFEIDSLDLVQFSEAMQDLGKSGAANNPQMLMMGLMSKLQPVLPKEELKVSWITEYEVNDADSNMEVKANFPMPIMKTMTQGYEVSFKTQILKKILNANVGGFVAKMAAKNLSQMWMLAEHKDKDRNNPIYQMTHEMKVKKAITSYYNAERVAKITEKLAEKGYMKNEDDTFLIEAGLKGGQWNIGGKTSISFASIFEGIDLFNKDEISAHMTSQGFVPVGPAQ